MDELLDVPAPAAVVRGVRSDPLSVDEVAANAAAQRYAVGMYIIRPSLAQMKYVCSNLKSVHGYGAHALFAAFLASSPIAHSVHPKYNTDVAVFELAHAKCDVAIVSGYKFIGSKARCEWLASGYWAERVGEVIQVQDAPEGEDGKGG